jgi:hypothetical protein
MPVKGERKIEKNRCADLSQHGYFTLHSSLLATAEMYPKKVKK